MTTPDPVELPLIELLDPDAVAALDGPDAARRLTHGGVGLGEALLRRVAVARSRDTVPPPFAVMWVMPCLLVEWRGAGWCVVDGVTDVKLDALAVSVEARER